LNPNTVLPSTTKALPLNRERALGTTFFLLGLYEGFKASSGQYDRAWRVGLRDRVEIVEDKVNKLVKIVGSDS
jgi:peptidoglycan/xylan/chitin deacetylase (PgdA/CDA1 family)